jgi:hypothetical protein
MIKVLPRAWGNPVFLLPLLFFSFFSNCPRPIYSTNTTEHVHSRIRLGAAGGIEMNEMP